MLPSGATVNVVTVVLPKCRKAQGAFTIRATRYKAEVKAATIVEYYQKNKPTPRKFGTKRPKIPQIRRHSLVADEHEPGHGQVRTRARVNNNYTIWDREPAGHSETRKINQRAEGADGNDKKSRVILEKREEMEM